MLHFDALKIYNCNKQFLLFSQCFLHYMVLIFRFECTLKMSSAICFNLDQSKILSSGNGLTVWRKKAFENIVGEGEYVDNQHFLLFPHCFHFFQFPEIPLNLYQKTNFRLFEIESICRRKNKHEQKLENSYTGLLKVMIVR